MDAATSSFVAANEELAAKESYISQDVMKSLLNDAHTDHAGKMAEAMATHASILDNKINEIQAKQLNEVKAVSKSVDELDQKANAVTKQLRDILASLSMQDAHSSASIATASAYPLLW